MGKYEIGAGKKDLKYKEQTLKKKKKTEKHEKRECWRREREFYKMSNLAFVLLITKAKTDINVPLAVLWQVLSLHQGDPKHPGPHLVLQLILLRFSRPLVWCGGLVLLQDKDTHTDVHYPSVYLLLPQPGASSCSQGT